MDGRAWADGTGWTDCRNWAPILAPNSVPKMLPIFFADLFSCQNTADLLFEGYPKPLPILRNQNTADFLLPSCFH